MNYGLVGLYGLYLIFVGYRGNAGTLMTDIGDDAKGFSGWALAIVILMALDRSDQLRPVIKPFIGLAVLTFILKNYSSMVTQLNEVTGLDLPTSA